MRHRLRMHGPARKVVKRLVTNKPDSQLYLSLRYDCHAFLCRSQEACMQERKGDSCPPAAPNAPPGPGGSPSPVVASVYADSSTIGLATRPPAIAAVPAGPTDCSDDAARTATAVRRRGTRRAAARQAGTCSAAAQSRLRSVQRIEVRVAGRGTRDRDHASNAVSAYDGIPVLRKGALHGEQGASRTALKTICMLHDNCVRVR